MAFGAHCDATTKAVQALRDQGAEIVVALTHLNMAEDREIAKTVPGIALILGGHDHDAVTLLEALENGVSRVEGRQGRIPQVSGIRLVYDPAKPAMHRILDVSVIGLTVDDQDGWTLRFSALRSLIDGGL